MDTLRPGGVPALSCRDITKMYESNHVTACRGINIDLFAGEIHCILGENGAGKSTLMRILTGDQHPDEGRIVIRGEQRVLSSPYDALKLGIGMIHQQSNCIGELTVWENIILGAENSPLLSRITMKGAIRNSVDSICRQYGFSLPYHKLASRLDSSGIQTAALVSLLHREADILIFDEPHPLFSGNPPPPFTDLARSCAAEGKTVVVVTHNLETAFSIASRITILRRGSSMGTFFPEELDIASTSRMMMGLLPQFTPETHRSPTRRIFPHTESMITLEHVTTRGNPDDPSTLKDVSFCVYPGEILACVGIREHGLTTLEGLLSSYIPGEEEPPRLRNGSVRFRGIHRNIADLAQFREAGGAYVPSNRLVSGTAVRCTLEDNAIIHVHRNLTGRIPGIIDRKKAQSYTSRLIRELSIQGKVDDEMISLSGGNIQKLIAARELALKPRFLIACEITWGLDIMTQEFLFNQVELLRKSGTAVLLITSETEIALKYSTRIAMFYRGRLSGIIDSCKASAARIGEVILEGAAL